MAPLPLKVRLIALHDEYGRPELGPSFEYHNLFLPLKRLFSDVELFDFYGRFKRNGKTAMNQELLDYIREHRPNLTIIVPFGDEFIPDIIDQLQDFTTTLCYFFDDIWRTKFAQFWIPHFHYFTTTQTSMLRRYSEMGYRNALYSPCGYNSQLYQRKPGEKEYDVSFIGGWHPYRSWLIKQLRKAGIKVAVWGKTWPSGRISHEGMIEVFQRTKIGLNLTDSATTFDLRRQMNYFLSSRWALRDALFSPKRKESMKARHFELAGCGTFQLSYYVEDLEHCFEIGKEIAIYTDVDDLIEKARYYLKHDEEREAIACAGYRRALAEHTMERRFLDIAGHICGSRIGLEHTGMTSGNGGS